MSSSEIEICNLALTRLGHSAITAFSEASVGASLAKLHYANTRDAVLRAHPWNFAIRRVMLAQETTTPAFEYTYQYALPADFLKIVRTDLDAQGYSVDYRIEGRKLLTDEGTIGIEYIARIEDVAQFDPMFVDCLAARLAAEIGTKLTDNAQMIRTAWEIYGEKIREARSVDAQEGTPRDIIADEWLLSRA
ncbi:MAG: hypothetical protein AB1781_10960 [Pseudomonadota bacterium]